MNKAQLSVVIKEYGLETVHEYMVHIRDNAEKSVRSLLKSIAKEKGTSVLTSVDYLDDGSPVRLLLPSFDMLIII